MTTAKSQAKWRERVAQGLVQQNSTCPVCQKPCRADSSKAPYHHKCWRTTYEGKAYNRAMKRKSRMESK